MFFLSFYWKSFDRICYGINSFFWILNQKKLNYKDLGEGKEFDLFNPSFSEQCKERGITYTNSGSIVIQSCKERTEEFLHETFQYRYIFNYSYKISFLDYISAGTKFSVVFAIDFTTDNEYVTIFFIYIL